MWVPIGLHTSVAVFEEWRAVTLVTTQSIGNMVPSTNSPTRPLRWVPHIISYYLSPHSHVGYNIYLITLFIMRGVFTFLLTRRLLRNTALGLAVAGLYLVYPADDGWFTFRAINIQTALVLGLLSLYLLSLYWDQPRRWLWVFILGTQVLSLLFYELFYIVFGLAPLLLMWLEGSLRLSRRLVRVSLLWYSTYSVLAARFLYIMLSGSDSYAATRVESTAGENLLDKFAAGLQTMYSNHLDGWRSISDEYVGLSLAIGLIAVIVIGWLMRPRQADTSEPYSWKRYSALLLAGPIFMMLTYAQYLLVERVEQSFRVYFVPSLGAAFFVAVVLYGLTRISRLENVLFPLCIGALMFVGGQKAIEQNIHYANQSIRIQRLLATIVAEVPQPVEGTVIIVVDEQEIYQEADILAGRSDHLTSALNYIYDTKVEAVLCTIDSRRPKYCEFTEDGVVETSRKQGYTNTSRYENLIIFYTRWDGTIALLEDIPFRYYAASGNVDYDPRRLIEPDSEPPAMAYTFFTCWPFDECDRLAPETPNPATSAHVDFSKPVPGGGWQQFAPGLLPSKDIISNEATLEFTLVPRQNYQFSFEVSIAVPELADSLVVEVNEQPVPLTYSWENYRLVFSSETPVFVDDEAVITSFRLEGDGDLKAFRFVSFDIAAVP